ncbi:MAG TPA: hypothetical protein VJG13_13975, partial [Thermoanaerobaculia bacterium]|nr:hypothetical protein [Thermoanaerobaculia bacterium]
ARHRLALDVLRLADTLGVELAFPTRTVWLHEAAEAERPDLPTKGPEAGRRAAAEVVEANPFDG